MLAASIPAKFLLAFGQNAGAGYIRAIPTASQIGIQNGAASLNDGFVPLNFLPVGSGGVPPFGQDMNGILYQITAWTQWYNAGGPISYDAAFSSANGGYPKGSILASTTFGNYWLNTVDANTTNPDSGGANWTSFTLTAYTGTSGVGVSGSVISLNYPPLPNVTTPANADTIALQAASGGAYYKTTFSNISGASFNLGISLGGYYIATGVVTELTASSGTFTVPGGVTKLYVRCWGAGGGGGGVLNNASTSGGGGAGYVEGYIAVSPGATIFYVVGQPAPGGTGATDGAAGGTTSFGSYLAASGGAGGPHSSGGVNTANAAGGTGAGGSFNVTGGYSSGGIGGGGSSYGGGSGGGAYSVSISPSGQSQTTSSPGNFPGGGGTGAGSNAAGSVTGGTGAAGLIIVQY
jgi:hypothetical protein